MTTTNEWDEAAEVAAEETMIIASKNDIYRVDHSREVRAWEAIQNKIQESIAKHFADLKATHEKLVELAVWCEREVDYADPSTDYDSFKKIIADPLVVAAIERSKG